MHNSQIKRRRRIAAEQNLYSTQQGKIKKPDVYGTERRNVKKVIANLSRPSEHDQEFDMEDLELDSDTITTAEYLIKSNDKSTVPICFVHQIYSILPNSTIVDRELQEAIQAGTWRKFHILGALEDEFVIIKTIHYIQSITEAEAEFKNEQEDGSMFDDFRNIVMIHHGISIKKEILCEMLSEKQIAKLVSLGFLLPHSTQLDLYWFSVRNQGKFINNLSGGRIELLRIIKKRSTRDIMEKLLKQKKLHKTVFNFEFLMSDLIGSGRVERCSTTMGNLIRLTNKGEKGI